MTVTAKPLFQGLQAALAETGQYTTPAGTRTIIDKFTGTNTSAAPANITIKLIASGGAAGASNTIVASKTLQPNETYTFPEIVGHVLAPGDSISTLASVANAITIRSSGREVS